MGHDNTPCMLEVTIHTGQFKFYLFLVSFIHLLEVYILLSSSTSKSVVIISFYDHNPHLEVNLFRICIISESKVDDFTSGK